MERLLLTRPSIYKLELLRQEAKIAIGDRLLDVNEVEPDKMAFYFHEGVQPGDEAACQEILNAHDASVLTPEEEGGNVKKSPC